MNRLLHLITIAHIVIGSRARTVAENFNGARSKYFPTKIVYYIRSFIDGRQVIQKVSDNFTTWTVEKCTYDFRNIDERLLR